MPTLAARTGFSWPLIIGAAAFLAVIAKGSFMLIDGDTYWHIATGQWIMDHWAIPYKDPFSHSLPGAPWTAHEWLSETLLHFAFQAAGWPGVVALGATTFAIALAYLTRFLLRSLTPVRALMFSTLALGMAIPHLLVRPHLLAMPLIVIWVAGLIQASEESRMPRLWLLGVMVLWANLHGGFTLGLAMTAAIGIEATLQAESGKRLAIAKKWLVFLAFSVVAGLFTPHGIEGILFTTKVMGMSYMLDTIAEWRSPDFHHFQFLELWLMLLLLAALTRGLRLSPVRLTMLLFLIHLGLMHKRNIELIGLISPLLLAAPIAAQWRKRPNQGSQLQGVNRFFMELAQPARLPAIVATFSLVGAIGISEARQGKLQPFEKILPIAAVKAVKEAHITGPVFNEYSFGGYLVFSGIPVFIDGRADMYGDEFLKQYMDAAHLKHPGSLEKLLDRYPFQWTLLPPRVPAVSLLDHLPGWRRLYSDEAAVVHIRVRELGSKP